MRSRLRTLEGQWEGKQFRKEFEKKWSGTAETRRECSSWSAALEQALNLGRFRWSMEWAVGVKE